MDGVSHGWFCSLAVEAFSEESKMSAPCEIAGQSSRILMKIMTLGHVDKISKVHLNNEKLIKIKGCIPVDNWFLDMKLHSLKSR